MGSDFEKSLETFYENSLGGTAGKVLFTILVLVVGGLCEIGGGWLVWQVLRVGMSPWILIPGSVILVIYGLLMSLQMMQFSRAFATYGGVFIFLSLVWGWVVDKQVPDKWDCIGAAIALVGAGVIAFVPR
ncbi:hypothetical protein K7432_016440 [Basidiobolus ranarum]|uniref:Uncharacterized protein n=1 Tax=Basidiobolus ranarum TaxID=34480 RepID=A0ABR2WER6_9FUNG